MRRRGHGEGGITKRRDGRWQGSWTDNTGKRRYLYATSRKEAAERLAEAVREKQHGLLGPEQTVAGYLSDWLERAEHLRPITRRRYEALIRLWIVPAFGSVQIRKLTPQHVANLLSSMKGRRSPATIGQVRNLLGGAMQEALEWRQIIANPVRGVRAPKVEKHEMQVLSIPEMHVLLNGVDGDPFEALYVLALTSGARLGELLALRWKDVDLEAGTMSISATLTRLDGKWTRQPPKTASSVRILPLSARGKSALRAHRIRMAEELLPLRYRTEGETLVFLFHGAPVNGFHTTERMYKPLLRRLGLPELRFHDLRHCFTSLMISEGVPITVISRMLGHSSVKTTMDTYAHLMPGDQQAAMARLDEVLAG
jgi:integrase